MKKKLIFLLLIFLLIPYYSYAETISSPEPWNYENGLLDDSRIVKDTNYPRNVFDNDRNTYVYIKGEYFLDFRYPVDVKGFYLDGRSAMDMKLILTFSNGQEEYQEIKGFSNNMYYKVNYQQVIRIEMENNGIYNYSLYEIEFFGVYEIPDEIPPGDVTGLTAEAGDGEVTLRYTFPTDEDFSHVKIYQDGNLLADNVKTTSYKVTGLSNGRKYTFRVVAVDTSGNESAGVTVSATPEEVSREVQNVRVTAKHDRVNLSWTNPKRNDFHHVKIYRKTLQNQALKIIPVARAAEGYDPIFETNGTYFNDLTVQPETSYEYLLTTEDKNGVESTGVTVQVTTPPIPPPSTGGTTIIRHENGDVTVRWTPQPGQMLIEIDGVEYRRVDAQLGEYTIPAADIPVDENGKPAPIRLIPIAPNGDMGTPIVINPGGWLLALPFGAKELLEAGIDLIAVFGPILLLVLVLWYVRPIMRLLREAARGRVRT